MASQPSVTLNDGRSMPQLGFGVWRVPDADARSVVSTAIETGYRSIDTAAIYGNEAGTGAAIAEAGVPRSELFITTKLWNDRQGYDEALRAFDESMARLGLETLDLYLIHWPTPARDRFVPSWNALIRLKEEGRVASIGVSNFMIPHLERLKAETGVIPALNQIELHPRLQQRELRAYHAANGIVTECWSPLGQGQILADPVIGAIAGKHGRTPAQVIIRWHLDNGFVVIPKSVTPARIRENFDVFGFSLDADDLAKIEALDAGGRIGSHPERMN